ncbi:MAG: Inorganic pyrophosphatase [Methanonatronarchaeales archaeon]|nr:Inorganic pyrophosphatase [Methanonatronarchaeales archaeon]
MNLWSEISTGEEPPSLINAVVECTRGSRNKYEYDKDIEAVELDRVLHSAVHYPADYGLIPRTWYDDDDPFDVIVLVEDPTFPGCVVPSRVVGMMEMVDDGEKDDKVLAVPAGDPRFDHVVDVNDVPPQVKKEITHFFETYKALEEGKSTETLGWRGRREAEGAVEHAMSLYREIFGSD